MLAPLRTSRRAPRNAPEKLSERRLVAHRQTQIAELSVHRCGRPILDARDAPAIQIQNGERFEYIVELARSERDGDVLAFANAPKMFEITDAALVENDAFDRKGSVYCRVALSPNPIWNRGADRQQKQTHVLRWNFHRLTPCGRALAASPHCARAGNYSLARDLGRGRRIFELGFRKIRKN